MVRDVLIEADPVLHLSRAIEDPEQYWELTDVVLKVIETSKDPALAKSRALIKFVLPRFCSVQ